MKKLHSAKTHAIKMETYCYRFLLYNNGSPLDTEVTRAVHEIGLDGLPIHPFLHALDVSGIEYERSEPIITMLGSGDYHGIASHLGIYSSVKVVEGDGYRLVEAGDPSGKNRVNQVNMQGHYAIDKTLPFTEYSLINHKDLEGVWRWNRVSGIGYLSYERDGSKLGIDTYNFFRTLVDRDVSMVKSIWD